jgi:hypothetical protein
MNKATHDYRVHPYGPRVPATERSYGIIEPLLEFLSLGVRPVPL